MTCRFTFILSYATKMPATDPVVWQLNWPKNTEHGSISSIYPPHGNLSCLTHKHLLHKRKSQPKYVFTTCCLTGAIPSLMATSLNGILPLNRNVIVKHFCRD